eukprot:s3209_g5.t1
MEHIALSMSRPLLQKLQELMLLGNQAVATKILNSFPMFGVLRRHPPPKDDQLKDPFFNTLVRIMTTRCMNQAVYFCTGEVQPALYSHYGLAMERYTHFTSPIRRYADVLAHRLLAASLGLIPLPEQLQSKATISEQCDKINVKHRMSQFASRASADLHTFMLLALQGECREKTGQQSAEAVVTRIRRSGMQVNVPRYGIEGVVAMPEEEWEVREEEQCILSKSQAGLRIDIFAHIKVNIESDNSDFRNRTHIRFDRVILDSEREQYATVEAARKQERELLAEDESLLQSLEELLEKQLAVLAGFGENGPEAQPPEKVAQHEAAGAACLKLARNLSAGRPDMQGRWWRRGLIERLAVQARSDVASPGGERSPAWCEAVPSFVANAVAGNPELRAEALSALFPHGLAALLALCWRRPDHGFLLLQNLFAADDAGCKGLASVERFVEEPCVLYMALSLLRAALDSVDSSQLQEAEKWDLSSLRAVHLGAADRYMRINPASQMQPKHIAKHVSTATSCFLQMVAGKWRSSWPSWALGLVSLAGLAAGLAWLAKRVLKLRRQGPRSLDSDSDRSAIPFLEGPGRREAPGRREGPLREEQPRLVPDHEAPAREERPGDSQASEVRAREEAPREEQPRGSEAREATPERPAPVAQTLPEIRSEGIAAAGAGAADAVQAPDARPFPASSSAGPAGPAEQLQEASEASQASPAAQAKATAKPSQAAAKKAAKATGMARGFLNKPAKKQNKKADSEATAPSASAASPASPSTAAVPEPQKEGKVTSSAGTAVATATAAAEDSTSAAVKEIARAQEAGVAAFHNCSFREAKASFERMRDTARAAGLGREEGQASRLLANALDKLDAPEAEIDAAYQQAMRKAHQHDDMELSFNVLTGMGSHAIKAGDLDMAEHLYQQSLMLAQRVLTVHEQGIAEGNLGMCLGQMEGRRPESLDHFKKAIKLQQEGSNPHAIVTLIANFASALCADGKYQEAKKEYENALVLTRRIGDRRVEVNILTNLANLCENVLQLPDKARQYRAALKGEYSKDSCAICLEALDSEGRAQTVLQCSHIYHSECIDQILSSESQRDGYGQIAYLDMKSPDSPFVEGPDYRAFELAWQSAAEIFRAVASVPAARLHSFLTAVAAVPGWGALCPQKDGEALGSHEAAATTFGLITSRLCGHKEAFASGWHSESMLAALGLLWHTVRGLLGGLDSEAEAIDKGGGSSSSALRLAQQLLNDSSFELAAEEMASAILDLAARWRLELDYSPPPEDACQVLGLQPEDLDLAALASLRLHPEEVPCSQEAGEEGAFRELLLAAVELAGIPCGSPFPQKLAGLFLSANVQLLKALHHLRGTELRHAEEPTSSNPDAAVKAATACQLVAQLRLCGNVLYESPEAAEFLRLSGGLPILLSHCYADPEMPLLREVGVFAVRNATQHSEQTRAAVKVLLAERRARSASNAQSQGAELPVIDETALF